MPENEKLPALPVQALPVIDASEALYARAKRRIPGVTQTLAKGPSQYVRGVAPKYLRRGRGSRVEDVDGNWYIDFMMAVGPISLGYAQPEVDAAIRAQLEDGITFSLMHPLEVEVAELIHLMVPGADMVRFSKTGADVTSAAVRLARAFTGRSKVLCCGYHGWHDWYIATTDRGVGVPAEVAGLVHTVAYNDIASVEQALDHDTACVILEPSVFESPRDGYLQQLLRLCHGRGALLVFDEMWTGFRCALGGAQERFGVTADLACFSKALANGMPLSVLSGRGDIMRMLDREVFFYTTFGGEALSLAAAKATLEFMRAHDVPAQLESQGQKVKQGYNELVRRLGLEEVTRCVGMGCRSMAVFEGKGLGAAAEPLLQKSLVQQELFRRGVLWTGFHNLCYAHSDADVAHLLAAYAEVLPLLRDALERGTVASALLGDPIEPTFRKTSGFHTKPRPAPGPPPPGELHAR